MNINDVFIRKIIPSSAESSNITFALFVVSAKTPRLKKLNLYRLSKEERALKLSKYGQESRFVAVIEAGDKVYAHVSIKYAQQLQNQKDLSIDGKAVSVKELTEEESRQLSLIGETFKDLKDDASKKDPCFVISSREMYQFFGPSLLISDQMHKAHLLAKIQNLPSEIVLNCLKRMSETRRELEKAQAEDEKIFQIKQTAIRKETLKKEVLTKEINASEIHKTSR